MGGRCASHAIPASANTPLPAARAPRYDVHGQRGLHPRGGEARAADAEAAHFRSHPRRAARPQDTQPWDLVDRRWRSHARSSTATVRGDAVAQSVPPLSPWRGCRRRPSAHCPAKVGSSATSNAAALGRLAGPIGITKCSRCTLATLHSTRWPHISSGWSSSCGKARPWAQSPGAPDTHTCSTPAATSRSTIWHAAAAAPYRRSAGG